MLDALQWVQLIFAILQLGGFVAGAAWLALDEWHARADES